jgi:hypothetical protein
MKTKACTRCEIEQPLDQFSKDKSAKGGLYPSCKTCGKARQAAYNADPTVKAKAKAYNKARYADPAYKERLNTRSKAYTKANPDKARSYALKSKYGITLAEYDAMFAAQNGSCKICGVHQLELKRTLAVDHCHKTQEVRGLLCIACNLGLGKFEDNLSIVLNAAAYLAETQGP